MDSTQGFPQSPVAVRVGDTERDACVMRLIGHHLHGRLSSEDLERRQRLAMTAVDANDLRLLLQDLPEDAATLTARPRSLTIPLPRAMPRGIKVLIPGVALLGVGAWGQATWEFSAEGHYYTAAMAGAVGFAAHAVASRVCR